MVLFVLAAVVLGVVATAALVAAVVAAQLRRLAAVEAASGDRQAGQQRQELRSELDRVTGLVVGLQERQAAQHGEMSARLAEAARNTGELADTARHLREALASPKARGQWGERMAEDVLRLAGFVEGVNFRRQTALRSGSIPDVTFLLPGGLLLNMDVKFPADNYLRALEATTAVERSSAHAAFVRDVRQRIKELTGRGYIEAGVTVDHVLLFLPNESIFSFVHEHDPTLVDTALRQRVVLCSPFTLFAVLAVIRQAVEAVQLEQTSNEVLQCLGAFGDQWDQFTEAMEVVGRRLVTAQRGFEELAGPRRRQLERQLDRLEDLRKQRGLEEPEISTNPRQLPEARAG
jgi:DNA recombination protein RmuC